MGIGRFAFTPILPLMQEDAGLSVLQGGWLASANYVGYLVGALTVVRATLRPDLAVRAALLTIALATMAMGLEHRFAAWVAWRALAGFASAWVLVHVSAWALEQLARAGRADLSGTVYAGVGVGIVVAGSACLVLLQVDASSSTAWIALGAAALLATGLLWSRVLRGQTEKPAAPDAAKVSPRRIPEFWRLVFCHGAFGLGYIIPATFLPLMAKQVIRDPGLFGWAWPVFGVAAVLSTLVAAKVARVMGQRGTWIVANLVMAGGVLVPIIAPGLIGIMIAALCVGGTFMVMTMVGFQEARRVAGTHAPVLMAAMTAAFALGQVVGPLLAGVLVKHQGGLSYALVVAAIPLFVSAYVLFANRGTARGTRYRAHAEPTETR